MSEVAEATGTEIPGEVEAKAREMGWRPKDEWEGDDAGWMEADRFMERQDKRRAVANEEFKTENEKLRAELKAEQAEMKATIEDFKGWQTKAEERIYKKALRDVQATQRKAVEDGDTEAFDAAQKEADELVADAQKPVEQRKVNPDQIPAYTAWHAKNSWYNTDLRLTREANALGPEINRIYGLTPEQPEFYEKITEQLKEDFPDKFENPARKRASAVEEGTGTKAKKDAGYSDLPAEAKAACDRFVKQKIFVGDDGKPLSDAEARKKYASDYFESED